MRLSNRDSGRPYVDIDRHALCTFLDACLSETELPSLRDRVAGLRRDIMDMPITSVNEGFALLPSVEPNDPGAAFSRNVLLEQLQQILEARTLRRAHYYLQRLRKSLTEVRRSVVNDINLNRWKEYDTIRTDSLWLVDRRDASGAHEAWYWGNFIPEIPRQMMLRYTRAGDWVLDPFAGSGTTLIECRRLGRHGLGIELNAEVVAQASCRVAEEPNPFGVTTTLVTADSTTLDFRALLGAHDVDQVQLLILHPPYHDIICFSDGERDLSNAPDVEAFIESFADVVSRARKVLEPGRYLVVVIGDKYQDGAWIPLGFYVMQAVMEQGCRLKSVVVKNLDRTRAKRSQQALWRYRALVSGFYVFKHEYILVFQT